MSSGARCATVLLAFGVLAVVWTWPLAPRLNWRFPHDPGDPLLVTWMLWWNTQAVPLTEAWWDAPIFFPLRGAFALSEHVFGISIFATPIQLVGGSPLLAYNVALLLSFALSGFFSFLLVRHLTGSTAIGFCAGVAYAFAPYRASQLSHLQVLTSQWMPLALYGLHRYLAEPRVRWLVLFGAATLVQGLSHGYYIFFFAVLLALWLAWFVDWRNAPRRGVAIVAAWMIASLPLAPILWKYREVQSALGLSRSLEEMLIYSGSLDGFRNVPPMLKFWPDRPAETGENYLFTGITIVVLIIAGLVAGARRGALARAINARSPFLFYGVSVVLMYALALGPARPDSGMRALGHPYTLLMSLPGFSALRVSARFAMLAVLCSSTAAGLALARLARRWPRSRRALVGLVLAGLVLDGWMQQMPLGVPPGRIELPTGHAAAVLELPADDQRVSIAAMYRSIAHGLPLINGYSGYTPVHYDILGISVDRGDPSAILELARGRPLIILVSERFDPNGHVRQLVESLPGIERHGGGSAGLMYLLPARPRASMPQVAEESWPFTTRQLLRSHVVLDLGATRVVRSIEFPIRRRFFFLDSRIAVEASDDGVRWTTVWEGWTGGPALAAALADPNEVVIKLTLPDVSTRYIRVHPARRWVWQEIVVKGPA